MADWRDKLQKQSIKYVVVGVAAANCAGIYLANERLNRPHTAPVTETFVAAADYADVASVRPSPAAESAPSLVSSAPALALDTSAEATALTRSEVLPALAPLPPLRLEAAPVIPSVPARAARLGMNENRVARTARLRRAPQVDRGFDSAFTPDYAALAPYDGTAETAALSETVQDAAATGSNEVRSEAISVDMTNLVPSTATSEASPARDSHVPTELPAVQLTAPAEQLPG